MNTNPLHKFVGRKQELAFLEEAYQSPQSALIPIYGRRRVGKTELILKFFNDKKGLFFVGKQGTGALQQKEFLQEAALALDEPLLEKARVDGWKQALETVVSRWKGPEKLILVLDEFQWMAEESPELPSVIQHLWDHQWKSNQNIMVILCGSFIGFMEREILGKKSPLFGRRTGQILLRPFNYLEAADFHPGHSTVDKARAYMICGGIPLYHRFFQQYGSIENNIIQNILSEFAPLYREIDFLLHEEFHDVEKIYAILSAIASGNSTNKQITQASGVGNNKQYYYYSQLEELRYIHKHSPISGEIRMRRTVQYRLCDPLLKFSFRFIYPNKSYIAQAGGEKAFLERIAPNLQSFFGISFEDICRQALQRIYTKQRVIGPYTIGDYWNKNVQIDVVGMREDNFTDLGECKWGDNIDSISTLVANLDHKVHQFPNPRNTTIQRHLFLKTASKRQRRDCPPHVALHGLEDLYAL